MGLSTPNASGRGAGSSRRPRVGQQPFPSRRVAPAAASAASPAQASEDHTDLKTHRLSIAPMMMWTDVHFRQLVRLMSKHTWLYTEMVVDNTLNYNPEKLDQWLEFPELQHPIALQLGGSNPEHLFGAAQLARPYGYDAINLNCGCPSDKVAGAGSFGATLMKDSARVADAVAAVHEGSGGTEVTVKCRIGVDEVDSYEELCAFVAAVSAGSPARHFVIHARKAILQGLSPAQNRSVPPVHHEWVYALARDFPDLLFSLNGTIESCHHATAHLPLLEAPAPPAPPTLIDPRLPPPSLDTHPENLIGVMIGRAAYERPWKSISDADREVYGDASSSGISRRTVLQEYAKYADTMQGRYGKTRCGGEKPSVRTMISPLLNLFHGEPRGKAWKRDMDMVLRDASSVQDALDRTLPMMPPEVLDAPPYVPDGQSYEPAVGHLPMLPWRGSGLQARNPPVPREHVSEASGEDSAVASHVDEERYSSVG